MEIMEIRDNGGRTIDRYTVIYNIIGDSNSNYECVSMNQEPFHPQGFGQHGTAMRGRHLGKKIKFNQLPTDCQKLVMQDLNQEVA